MRRTRRAPGYPTRRIAAARSAGGASGSASGIRPVRRTKSARAAPAWRMSGLPVLPRLSASDMNAQAARTAPRRGPQPRRRPARCLLGAGHGTEPADGGDRRPDDRDEGHVTCDESPGGWAAGVAGEDRGERVGRRMPAWCRPCLGPQGAGFLRFFSPGRLRSQPRPVCPSPALLAPLASYSGDLQIRRRSSMP